MSELRKRHPYEFFTRGNTIRANVETAKRRRWDYVAEHPADSFKLPGAVQDWLDTEFDQEVRYVPRANAPILNPLTRVRLIHIVIIHT